MSSFSHLAASHNSNNGNPKKHWRAPARCDSAIWEAARRFAGITQAHPPPADTARKLVLRQGTESWPARPVVGNLSFGASEESIRALFETHGTVSLRLVPAQAPCLQRVRSPEVVVGDDTRRPTTIYHQCVPGTSTRWYRWPATGTDPWASREVVLGLGSSP